MLGGLSQDWLSKFSAQQQAQQTGAYTPRRVSYNGSNAEQLLSQISDEKIKEYDAVYRPVNRELIDSLDSTELVDIAKGRATANDKASSERSKRMSLRYGMTGSELDRSRADYTSTLSRGASADGLVNSARIDQFERNVGLRDEMIAVGRGIATSSANGLASAANAENAVSNANAQARAQEKAAKTQMMGQLGGMALMAAFLM